MESQRNDGSGVSTETGDNFVKETPAQLLAELDEVAAEGRMRMAALDPELADAVGFTHFDTGSSEDNLLTVLLARDDLTKLASQTLVRIKSREDKRSYLGVVVKGPFSEPDAVPPNSTMAVGVVVQGKKVQYTFDYHGRAEIEILGEESGGNLVPPRYRPRTKRRALEFSAWAATSVSGRSWGTRAWRRESRRRTSRCCPATRALSARRV